MESSDKRIQDLRTALEKTHGRTFSWEEAMDAFHDMERLAQNSIALIEEKVQRQIRLKEFPNGFHLEKGGYTCLLCSRPASYENSWYDRSGLKCRNCQHAIDKKIIPRSVAKDRTSWYSKTELETFFNLKGSLLNRCLKQGFLKERVVPGKGKSAHLRLFLIKDNKEVLPPKRLLRSRISKTIIDGEEYYTSEHWYEFVDEKHARQIAKYGISVLFPATFAMPIQSGRFYFKTISPIYSFK